MKLNSKLLFIILGIALCFASCASTAPVAKASSPSTDPNAVTDYTKADNWLYLPAKADKKVDVFYIYPTSYYGDEKWCLASDAGMRSEARNYGDTQVMAFSDSANIYAPFYRQIGLTAMTKFLIDGKGTMPIADLNIDEGPLVDCQAAFEYYLAHYANNRPIIFASHSQGTMIMRDFLRWVKAKHPEVIQRMVAAYMIGFSINQAYCDQVGIPFATGADDTGVIISYNTEGPGADFNPLRVLPNPLAINPINWKRDATPATADESKGSRIEGDDGSSGTPVDKPHFADAVVDLARGTVLTHAAVKAGGPWPTGVLHLLDYQLFYYDLRANAATRIAAYFAKAK
jgi:hypothetical protein